MLAPKNNFSREASIAGVPKPLLHPALIEGGGEPGVKLGERMGGRMGERVWGRDWERGGLGD